MKKKIISLCLVIALALTAVGGATLAYFTDNDRQDNNFTIGNIDIKVDEYGYVWDKSANNGNGGYVNDAIDWDGDGFTFKNLMPSYIISKRPIVKNISNRNDAYVRVAVVMNNVDEINDYIDDVYEAKGKTDDEIQAIYNNVFAGWGVNYNKRNVDGNNDRRMWMTERTTSSVEGVEILFGGQIDMYCDVGGYSNMFDVKNTFKSESDTNKEGFDYENTGYYSNATNDNERIYVFYLKMEHNTEYQLFGGLNIPADFTNEQMKMFQNLHIGIYADAIQTVGFADTTEGAMEAFTALEAEHPLGWWND